MKAIFSVFFSLLPAWLGDVKHGSIRCCFVRFIFNACLPLFFLFSCGGLSAQELKEGYFPDGKLRYKGYFVNDQPSGRVTHYYKSGSLRAVMNHKGHEADAVLYGEKDTMFTVSGKYLARKKTGEWLYRRGDILLLKEGYADGLLNGAVTRYFKAGGVAEVKNWKSGVLSGEWKLFYDNGKVRLQAFYVNGKVEGQAKSYNYEGNLVAEGEYKNNLKEGVWHFYDKTGKLTQERSFHLGVDPEAKDSLETEQVDVLVNMGSKIPDPADFMDDPDAYLKLTEE